eukprot:TRINITY_DN4138_c2_g1_i6.p1 TRINITY_DN4138_c2_g1~~TRINITY_DN4138_c2_g1_i6.p1  ORF type:complete len:633 (+),score=157.29 TRINITY_DN4138_c2_g1_i6:94-1992(+)
MGRRGSGRNAKAVMRLAPERKPRMRLALGCGRHDPTPEPWPRKARMHLVQTGGCTPTKRSDADGAEPQRADGSELRAYEVARSTPRRRYAADSVSPLSSSQGCTPSATASPSPERTESLERLEHPVLTQAAAALAELARSQARAAAAAEALRLEREARSRDEAAHGAERMRLQRAADELRLQVLPHDEEAARGAVQVAADTEWTAMTRHFDGSRPFAASNEAGNVPRSPQAAPAAGGGSAAVSHSEGTPGGGGAEADPMEGERVVGESENSETSGDDEESDDPAESARPQGAELRVAEQRGAALLASFRGAPGGGGTFGDVSVGTVQAARKQGKAASDPVLQKKVIDSLAREERLLRRINGHDHPGTQYIVQLFAAAGLGSPSGALLLERLGDTLAAAAPLAGGELERCVLGLLQAFSCLYELDIAHFDVKPENVMVGPGGAPKVIDFGISRLEGERVGVAYTYPYRPLEWLIGCGRRAALASDAWALGLAMWYAAKGFHPARPAGADGPAEHLRLLHCMEGFVGQPCGETAVELWQERDFERDLAGHFFEVAGCGWQLKRSALPCPSPCPSLDDADAELPGLAPVLRALLCWDPSMRASPDGALKIMEDEKDARSLPRPRRGGVPAVRRPV